MRAACFELQISTEQSGKFVAQHIVEQFVQLAVHQVGNAFDVFFPDDFFQTGFQYLTEYTISASHIQIFHEHVEQGKRFRLQTCFFL
jgi:hypothetical protein